MVNKPLASMYVLTCTNAHAQTGQYRMIDTWYEMYNL